MLRVEAVDRGYNTAADESDSAFAVVPDLSGVSDDTGSGRSQSVELIGSERNPSTGMTHIIYSVPARTYVRLAVYNVRGRVVKTLVTDVADEGYNSAVWDGRSDSGSQVAPGVYFINLSALGVNRTRKIVLKR
jgi:flagellar hook assembly protein FlgD